MTKKLVFHLPTFAFLAAGTLLVFAIALTVPAAAQPGEPIIVQPIAPIVTTAASIPPPIPPSDVGTPELLALTIMVASYALRRYARRGHWAHSEVAQWIIPLGSGAAEAAAKILMAGTTAPRAVAFGALSYVLTWLMLDNTSQGKEQPALDKLQPPDPPKEPV